MIHNEVNNKYKENLFDNITFVKDGLTIPLSHTWNKIGISVSGGADSALLSYLLCNQISSNNLNTEVHIISNVRMWKSRPWQRYDSINVYNWLQEKFPMINFVRHENFIPPELEYGVIGPSIKDERGNLKSGDQIITRSHAEWICFSNNLDAWYSAITKNPSNTSITKGMPDRNENIPVIDKLIIMHNKLYICHPFSYTEKNWIIKQYLSENITDLLDITRSCEGEFDNINYKNYIPGQSVPVCNECFWCQERQWAMEENNV